MPLSTVRTVLLACAVTLAGGTAHAEDPYNLVPRIGPRLLRVNASAASGAMAVGSGVMVAPATVLTSCHVTRGAQVVEVWAGGQHWRASGQNADQKRDICVLHVPDAPDMSLPVAAERPSVGDVVLGAGYSGGLELRYGIGEVTALHAHSGGQVIQTGALFDSGASGGGLFNDRGELVGLVTFRLSGDAKAGWNFSVPVEWVIPLLDVKSAPAVKPDPSAKSFWELERGKQPLFLQAAALESEANWQALDQLTAAWTDKDLENAGAWLFRSRALLALGKTEAATEAAVYSVSLEADNGAAWFQLGLAYKAANSEKGISAVKEALAKYAPRLAEEFAKR